MRRRDGILRITRTAASEQPQRERAVRAVLDELGGPPGAWLLIGVDWEDSECFRTLIPAASAADMAGALKFEAPREVMRLPEDFQLQFVTHPAAEPGMCMAHCCVFPGKARDRVIRMLEHWRRKPDAVLSPLLALPEELSGAPVRLPGLESDFYYANGTFHPFQENSAADCNTALLAILKRDCRWEESAGKEDYERFLTPVLLAHFGMTRLWRHSATLTTLNMLPARLRPARYRTQIRVMVVLLVLYLGLLGWDFLRAHFSTLQRYRSVKNELDATRDRVAKLQRKLKSGEKEQKDLTRIAELKIGDRTVIGYLALLSEKLPDDVMVSSLRWNDGVVDLVLQTESEIDLVAFFNRLSGFKVLSASQRTNNNNLTFANVKLTTDLAGGKKK